MEIIETVAELKVRIKRIRNSGKTIGFVPTMGALHKGHGELVKHSVKENDITVVSIFVNPDKRMFDFGGIDKVLEGEFRPGHFNGVAQVVSKLFDFVKPDKAYFGEKDIQQLAIIRQMVKQLHMPVEIVGIPIIREESGLAMSSRNQRLDEEEKKTASKIYNVLKDSVSSIGSNSPEKVTSSVIERLNSVPGLQVEYFSIVESDSFEPVVSWNKAKSIFGCIAVYCGDVRLIDNIRYK
jgi:pantoate--beta-alanine ligase